MDNAAVDKAREAFDLLTSDEKGQVINRLALYQSIRGALKYMTKGDILRLVKEFMHEG